MWISPLTHYQPIIPIGLSTPPHPYLSFSTQCKHPAQMLQSQSIYYIHLSFTSASTSTNLCSFSLFHHDANLDLVRKPTGQNLSDPFGKYSSLKDVSNTCGTVANKPNVPTRPKAGELLLLSGQNWAPSDCQICSTSVGIGQIGPGAIFGSIAETNILLVICSNAVEQWSCWPE